MNKTEIKKFRKWMLETYGIQDASNYEGTQTEEIAIRYAETKVKKLNKPVVSGQVCKCGNDLTEKEIFYETCLKCDAEV